MGYYKYYFRKFEANFVKSNFKTKFDKPVKYNKVFKKQSFKPKESFAILTINKSKLYKIYYFKYLF